LSIYRAAEQFKPPAKAVGFMQSIQHSETIKDHD
jgi:hypothetical protein